MNRNHPFISSLDETGPNHESWAQRLQRIQAGRYASGEGYALHCTVSSPLEAMRRGAFPGASRAQITLGDDRFHTRISEGSIHPIFAEAGKWDRCDVLMGEFQRVAMEVDYRQFGPGCRLCCSEFFPSWICLFLYFARLGGIGFRVGDEFWHQEYRMGWPLSAPLRLPATSDSPALVTFGVLEASVFGGLPFSIERARQAVPEPLDGVVDIYWRPDSSWNPSVLEVQWAEPSYR